MLKFSFRHLPPLAAAALLLWSGAAQAKPENGKVFGKWVVQCDPATAGGEAHCGIAQTLLVTETKERLITVQVVPNPKGELVVAAVLPLGINLPAGVTLQFANGGAQAMVVRQCLADGCLAVTPLTPGQITDLRGATDLKVRALLPGLPQPADIPLSLEGFGAALDSLK